MDNSTLNVNFDDLLDRLAQAIEQSDATAVVETLKQAEVDDTAKLVDRLDADLRKALFNLLSPEQAADVLENVYYFQGADIIEEMEPDAAAQIITNLDSDDRADLLNELDDDDSEAILDELEHGVAAETRQFMAYEDGTAGALMYSEFVSFKASMTVASILQDIQSKREKYIEYGVQYAYVLGVGDALLGVLPVRNLLFAKPDQTAGDIMIPKPITVDVNTPVPELERLFEQYNFLGLPVVDGQNHLLGIVDRDASTESLQETATEDLLKLQGLMGKEELRSMPLGVRSRRRLSWLSINIVLNLISASVIAYYQDTLEAVIALAVFIPIISDMSGCSGNQAVAVSMRELSLDLISPKEFGRVFIKESSLGLINGASLGLLIGFLAWLWKGNLVLSFVIAAALALNTIIAVCVGGLVPLLLKAMKQDPALASGPILTTITDMCGFLLILGLATLCLPYLI
ncbi:MULTISPECIES: magnesium transporter [unclassified Lentimonas]|uniref:magnesium transporter n=1 Tax=unclassified Lentimonas TaxID=2630993 RepID=UPI0013274581|nr:MULTISPECIES: magnesium transporter [unclassified Lentimonas]CAA6677075.1 Mg/Co/Ni transporter MgtE / CBS domain [Lentimonas sp. CC4]CAA6687270.1 Mg/Co/Ni transporter MgtE / CBS domain [Lentimonas sp. CC6]CAA6692346.1 Mg/Co/Ni transporter MgtE / CBS domain [Lentimonas sp. CC10]CAA6694682.1 Mg/Co/Ni transporter MgtE / CBS domain [Lentimonas sp. CC19]CAA7071428.1 Mg/Co/Ni transporter MgtE / CBS domain [Lentimonas sp. CC11]